MKPKRIDRLLISDNQLISVSYEVEISFDKLRIYEGKYVDYLEQGFQKIYNQLNRGYNPRYYLSDDSYYVDGQCHGQSKEFYQDGSLWKDYTIKRNIKHGYYKKYHDNGKLCVKCDYVKGDKHGAYKRYHYTGELSLESNYKYGKLDGICKRYCISGKIQKEAEYKDGLFQNEKIYEDLD